MTGLADDRSRAVVVDQEEAGVEGLLEAFLDHLSGRMALVEVVEG